MVQTYGMGLRYEPITVFILAGGPSSRMGEPKAFMQIAGKSLIDYAVAQAHSVGEDVFVVGDKIMYGAYGRIVTDIHEKCGPLGGIHAALTRTKTEFNLMLALDTPFLTKNLLNYLNMQAQKAEKTVTVPKLSGGYNPLCAIYRKDFLHRAEGALQAGNYKIDSLFIEGDTLEITEAELIMQRFEISMFANINTPEDFARANTRKPDLHG